MASQTLSYNEVIQTAKKIAATACDLASPDLDVRSAALNQLESLVQTVKAMPRSKNDCNNGCHMDSGFCIPDPPPSS